MTRVAASPGLGKAASAGFEVPTADLHHMDVLALTDDIAIAAAVGMSRRDTETALWTLLSRIGADLFAEEYLMLATDYPELGEQQCAHREFASRLSEAFSAFACGDDTALDPLLACVHEWVCDHALAMDRQFETYLQALRH